MKKRTVIFGDYNTAEHGWTLSGLTLSDPEQKTNYVEKSGGDGSWDLSTVLTNGLPRYKNRTLTVTLECSKWNRDKREILINELVNLLDGLEWKIVLPDRPDHYLEGRLHVAVTRSDLSYAAVTVTGVCAPWLYSARETVVELTNIGPTHQTVQLINQGRMAVSPRLTTSDDGIVILVYNGLQATIKDGVFEWPALLLTPGYHTVEYWGTGKLTISYREAVLR